MTQIVANGLVIGSIYGLVAVGLSLVYKKSKVLHFSNAESGMVGAFVFFALTQEQGWSWPAAAAVGVALSAGIGGLTYVVLSRRRDDPLAMLVGTLAVAGILIFIGSEIWGPTPQFVPPPAFNLSVSLGGVTLAGARLLVLIVATVLVAVLYPVFRYTRIGLIFRASATDSYAAELMGVNVWAVDLAAWALAGALAGLAGILVAPLVSFHLFFMTLLAVRGFAAALLAGMDRVAGSLVGGLVLGIAEAGVTRFTAQPGLPEALLVLMIITILTVRPARLGRGAA